MSRLHKALDQQWQFSHSTSPPKSLDSGVTNLAASASLPPPEQLSHLVSYVRGDTPTMNLDFWIDPI
ncbi:MAG: hypothetical protein ACI83Y_001188 [Candidatus Azotimanducaceae bacterium]|jgi:hypothetical protein|tara:strand:- start:572 stop:772 length:201 start_codon:yes stop_codon:yes gene_type:complete